VGPPAEEFDVGPGGETPKTPIFGALPNNAERDGCPAAGVDRQIQSLIGDERRHDESTGAGTGSAGVRTVELSVYGRIHNGRPAIIVSAYSARNVLRVREKA